MSVLLLLHHGSLPAKHMMCVCEFLAPNSMLSVAAKLLSLSKEIGLHLALWLC